MSALIDNANFQRHPFVEKVSGINNQFSDNGLFGISIEGAGSHSSELLGVSLETLNRLKNKVSDEDLALVKNRLKMDILKHLESSEDRLEEITKNYLTFGDLTFHRYCD